MPREVLKSFIRDTVCVRYATRCISKDYFGVFSEHFKFTVGFNLSSTKSAYCSKLIVRCVNHCISSE